MQTGVAQRLGSVSVRSAVDDERIHSINAVNVSLLKVGRGNPKDTRTADGPEL